MRNYNSIFEVKNTLSGILCASNAIAYTLHGNSIDTIGFNDMMGILCLGVMKGSGAGDAAGADVTVKFQESINTTGPFSDIETDAINGTASVWGSAKFDVVSCVGGSTVGATMLKQRKLYIKLNTGNRMRYIRAQAGIAGTTTQLFHINIAVAAILGKPRESRNVLDTVSDALASSDIGTTTTTMGFIYSSVPTVV